MTSRLRATRFFKLNGNLSFNALKGQTKARAFSTTNASTNGGGSGTTVTIAALLAAAGGAGYYYKFYGPGAVVPAPGGPVKHLPDSKHPHPVNYEEIYEEIAKILDDTNYDDGSFGPVLVRLAWHASGTYNKATNDGGSNKATMRFQPESAHGGNKGLTIAREKLEAIRRKYPGISYGDLWTLAGVCAIQQMDGPVIPWRPGRIDGFEADCTPDGRLPDGSKDASHVRDIFYRMGWNDQEIVALSGAHALGRCHTDRSGFDGPWTPSPTLFTNDYFKRLLKEKWVEKKWKGPKQFVDEATGEIMMLPTDMSLISDDKFKPYVELYANDEQRFFEDFSKAAGRLFELGVPFTGKEKVYRFKKV